MRILTALILLSLFLVSLGAMSAQAHAQSIGGSRTIPYVSDSQPSPQEAPMTMPGYLHLRVLDNNSGSAPNLDLPVATYDEQIWETFTQSFTSIAYNVTATVQTDSNGYGPSYLLNGISSTGYWYQVGLQYNWPGTTESGAGTYTAGFQMGYEVFNPSGGSVFPTNGGGGARSFSGAINPNDIVLLNLYFSSGTVVMQAHDWNTGATATETYSAEDASSFVGGTTDKGFLTGLMTEWWHASEWTSNEAQVTYSDTTFALSSATITADEWIPPNGPTLFSSPSLTLQFTNPNELQSFSSNGLTAYADAYEFITGALATAQTSITLQPAGESTPISSSNYFTLSYSLNGVQTTAHDGGGTVSLNVDMGTNVLISSTTSETTSSEEWVFDSQVQSVTVPAGSAISLFYYDLLEQTTSYSIFGGGAPSAPLFSYSTAPESLTTTNTLYSQSLTVSQSQSPSLWLVRGSTASVTQTITGGASERWSTQVSSWVISSPLQVPSAIPYYHQYSTSLSYQVIDGGSGYGAPTITCSSFGSQFAVQFGQSYWLDAGSTCSLPPTLPGSTQTERWATAALSTNPVSGPQPTTVTYYNQYSLALDYVINGGGPAEPAFLTGTSLGAVSSVQYGPETTVWLDASSPYSVSNPLPTSLTNERWITQTANGGVLTGPSTFSATYYNQYEIFVTFAVVGGGSPAAPTFSYNAFGSPASVQLSTASQSFWADAGASYSVPGQLGSAQTERWSTPTSSGTIESATSLTFNYYHQYLLTVTGAGLSSQWFNASSTAAISVPGVFDRVSGSGQRVTSYSIDGGAATLVQPTSGRISVSVLMNAAHTLSISSVNQYQVTLDATAAKALSSITPPTIGGDSYWYDQGTSVKLVLYGIWNRSSGTGERLESYTVNGNSVNVDTAGQVNALSIASLSSPEVVSASAVTQYQLSTTSGSISSITPPQIAGDSGWYDSGTSVVVGYDYSWNATAQSRINAVSYTIDQGAATALKRAGDGTFQVQVLMTTPHTIAVQSVRQYLLTVSGGNSVLLSASSPTGDSYYDSGSTLTATTEYTWGLTNGNTRQNLVSYSLDGTMTNVTRAESGTFTTPAFAFNSPHQLTFNSVTQYLVSFSFQDSSGTTVIQPTLVQIQLDNPSVVTLNGTQVWLDSMTGFQIHKVVWEDADVTPTGQTVYTASGPVLEKVPLRVYSAAIAATDYLNFPISGASVTVTLVNGTTLQRTTGSNGVAQLGLIPVGSFQGKMSYLGVTTTVAGNASTQTSTPVKVLLSYPFIVTIALAAAIIAVVLALIIHRRQRSRTTVGS